MIIISMPNLVIVYIIAYKLISNDYTIGFIDACKGTISNFHNSTFTKINYDLNLIVIQQ